MVVADQATSCLLTIIFNACTRLNLLHISRVIDLSLLLELEHVQVSNRLRALSVGSPYWFSFLRLEYSAMVPSTNSFLPPELVDMIIQHLSGDKYALRSCALVSRNWSGFGQRALFRDAHWVDLSSYQKMAKLLDDLISVPHLQTLVRGLKIYPYCYEVDRIPLPAYMSCLASVLSLLPNLMKVAFENDDYDSEDVAIRSYLDLIPNVLGNGPLVELDIAVFSVETFHHVFGILGGTNIKRVSLSGIVDPHEVDTGPTWKRLHVPSLEVIHLQFACLFEEFQKGLMQYFDLPNLKQCEIVTGLAYELLQWQNVLRRGFPPLQLFKLELDRGFPEDVDDDSDILEDDAYCAPKSVPDHKNY
ncbi:hypothetical protein BDZ89DRAFT_1052134 [Hymenopellis radicata]|nr:hypothetical protein BDZ89DRAFT_1052134 [Hymenopellis radicata]